jgi:DNA-binding MarR family transcriptional regulator
MATRKGGNNRIGAGDSTPPARADRGGWPESPSGESGPGLDLDRFLPYRISVLQLAVSRCLARIYGTRFNLSRHEWRAIAVLGQEQPLTANDICRRTSMDKVQVSRAVAALAAKGLVVRRPDPRDRRRGPLRLTGKGRAVYREIAPLALARERELLAAFNASEVRDLERLLGKLHGRADELLAREDVDNTASA